MSLGGAATAGAAVCRALRPEHAGACAPSSARHYRANRHSARNEEQLLANQPDRETFYIRGRSCSVKLEMDVEHVGRIGSMREDVLHPAQLTACMLTGYAMPGSDQMERSSPRRCRFHRRVGESSRPVREYEDTVKTRTPEPTLLGRPLQRYKETRKGSTPKSGMGPDCFRTCRFPSVGAAVGRKDVPTISIQPNARPQSARVLDNMIGFDYSGRRAYGGRPNGFTEVVYLRLRPPEAPTFDTHLPSLQSALT